MKTVYKFKVIILMLYLTACGGSGGGASSDAKVTQPSTPAIIQPPAPGGSTPSTFAGTYYTLVKNANVTQGGHTYPITMTGHCANYGGLDYCWDDGWQTVPAINFETDFWQLCSLGGTVGQCSGGGSTDPVTTPHLWSSMVAHLPTPPFQPSDIYSTGIATAVTCSLTGAVVDCVDFQIDTAQASL